VLHGTVLGAVDRLPLPHRVATALDTGAAGQVEESLHGLPVDAVLGIVEEQVAGTNRKSLEAPLIRVEQLPHRDVVEALALLHQKGEEGLVAGHAASPG